MKLYEDKTWLYQKYVVEGLSMEKVARLCNPQTTAGTILRWLKRHGIESRSLSEAGLGIKHRGLKKGKDTFRSKEWMIQKYANKSLSGRQIAVLCGVSKHTIMVHLRKHDIETRPKGPQKGEKNVHWKGGRKAADDRRRKTPSYKVYHEKWLAEHPRYMTKRGQQMKQRAVEYMGGKCSACPIKFDGTNACVFDFHHRDPSKKDLNIAQIINRKWKKIKIELDKTDMMCSNCHRLKHSNNGGNDVPTPR